MTKNELLKLLILLARYVEIYHESTSDHNMNALSDAYSAVQNKLLGCVDRTMKPVELFDIVDTQCKVAQEGADVKALEADNKRLRTEIMRLQSDNAELLLLRDMEHERCRAERQEADNIRASRLAIAEALDTVKRERDSLRAQLTTTWQPIDVQQLARTRRIGCVCTEGCQDAAGVYPNNILQIVNKIEQRYADIKLPANVRLCEQVPS